MRLASWSGRQTSRWPSDVSATPRKVDSAAELVGFAELVDMVFYKVAAERLDIPEREAHPSPRQAINVNVWHDDERMEVRCNLEMVHQGGKYDISVAARYKFSEPTLFDAETRDEFIKRVGVMTIYPYLRETVHQSAAKLRMPFPVLGLLKAGEIELAQEKPADESSRATASR